MTTSRAFRALFVLLAIQGTSSLCLAQPTAAAAKAQPAASTTTDPVIELSPFTVTSERDFGYRATNAMTGTRTGVSIMETPMNIAVLTNQFLTDISAQNLNDGLNYVSSVSTASLGNNGRIGGSGDGTRLRGFQASFNLRNGFRRDRGVTIRNIERVEVAKGPVSLLYGQTTPGGLINYITKKPKFQNAASLRLEVGSEELSNVEIDVERSMKVFRKDAADFAVRVMASQERQNLFRDYEYQDDDYVIGQISWQPTAKLNVLVEHEYLDRKSNLSQGLPRTNLQWQADWKQAVAQGRTTDATNWYANIDTWANDIHARTGVRPLTLNAFDANAYPKGQLDTYNLSGPDTQFNSRSNSTSLESTWVASDQFSARYGFNQYRVYYLEAFNFADRPNADSTFNINQMASRNNGKVITSHQVDLTAKFDASWLKSTFVGGAEIVNDYETNRRLFFDVAAGLQAQGISRVLPAPSQPDRGPLQNAVNSYDPSTQPAVLISKQITMMDRFQNKSFIEIDRTGYYGSYRGTLLNDKLIITLGLRREKAETQTYSPSSGVRTQRTVAANTPMAGINYRLTKNLVAFAGYSESFVPTPGLSTTGPQARADEITFLPLEVGKGNEFGLKFDTLDHKLSGTISYYNIERTNISSLNFEKTRNDPRNRDPNAATGYVFPFNVSFFEAGGRAVSQGFDGDMVYSPKRNLQVLFSFSRMIKAEFVDFAALLGTGRLANGTVVPYTPVSINGTRIPRTPEWSSSVFGKYTFVDGAAKGLSLGLGAQYQSSSIVFGNVQADTGNDNPYATRDMTGLQAEAHLVFDGTVGYETKIGGHPTNFLLSVKNLTDKEYIGGSYTPAYPRRISLSARIQF